ncbi:MAG TPA: 3-carboxy-cis,cis-muconate cycloisomerase [Solirubrobacteraceae bacterium]|nr:3-carboxy-cis,cis-muconate cycloisomerase [Solirubrobacteraceae bacterium]
MFDAIAARGEAAAAVSDAGWLQAMLDAEAALARALATAGVISGEEAEAIAGACVAERFDAAAIAAAAGGAGNPVVPLKAALTEAVDGPAAGHVHRGATSQDILDTAAMLVAARALDPLLDDLLAARSAAGELARAHRDTPMAGRTLLQQAVPVTFGLKAAGWMAGLEDSRRWLNELRVERLAAQLGGAAGTLASLGEAGPRVAEAYAEALGLPEPVLPWHTLRGRIGELASALAVTSGAAAKVARDVVLLSQTEVAEVREARGGGSSTMPHKRNPVAAICALACAQQAPGLAATLLGAMAQEHERAAGSWHAEWRPLGELLRSTGSAVAWLRESLEDLEADPERMRANLDATGGRLMAERVSVEIGGPEAERALEAADFRAAVAALVGEERAAELLDPAGYLGSAGALVDRAVDFYDREG